MRPGSPRFPIVIAIASYNEDALLLGEFKVLPTVG